MNGWMDRWLVGIEKNKSPLNIFLRHYFQNPHIFHELWCDGSKWWETSQNMPLKNTSTNSKTYLGSFAISNLSSFKSRTSCWVYNPLWWWCGYFSPLLCLTEPLVLSRRLTFKWGRDWLVAPLGHVAATLFLLNKFWGNPWGFQNNESLSSSQKEIHHMTLKEFVNAWQSGVCLSSYRYKYHHFWKGCPIGLTDASWFCPDSKCFPTMRQQMCFWCFMD